MAAFFKFYYLCAKDAWEGSLEKANAWATILGAFIIWAALWAWGYQLMLPDTLGYGIVVVVVCLFAAWITIFIVRFVCAPTKRFATLEQENARLKSDRSILEVRSGNVAPYYWTRPGRREFYFRVGIFNAGPKAAENVQIALHKATKPRCLSRDDFPYRVVRAGREWGSGHGRGEILIEDVRVNPLTEELFDVAHYWYSSENKLYIDKIDTKTHGDNYRLNIEPDERWELQYEVTAANAAAVTFRLAIEVREGALNLEKIA